MLKCPNIKEWRDVLKAERQSMGREDILGCGHEKFLGEILGCT